ncbi:MAG TPA: Glu-tRNA(Gln) amidotransferase subunit GatD [Candidatus Nanoarchaeia archaeon]|nr:Glu-tRNA(Gln) amidotransferase subunit GatD [Candidatus Nanoarchaeia archaeon]
MHKAGDRVKIHLKDEIVEGIFMPNEETDSIVIKLDNGYTIGIDKKNVKKIEKIGEAKKKEEAVKKIKTNPSLPKITILHTGGTIASKVDYKTGAVFTSFKPEDLLGMFPELSLIANFESKLLANMWSDDLRFKHFELIARAIEKEVKAGVEGIIVGMGTDNLAVASAALAFIIESTPVPILFVGAQRSSDRGSSDAAMNLICAAEFIAKSDFAGVGICMHENMDDKISAIFPPCKTRKLHSSRRDAFKTVNSTVIARINYDTRNIDYTHDYTRKDKKRDLAVKPNMEEKVGLLKVHVNMFPEQFSFFEGYKGLVIEGTGLGHIPGQAPDDISEIHKKIYPAVKKVIDSGCIVVMTTQCIYGRVQLHVYSKGTDEVKLGIISGEDMLAETALVKLSWLLGNHKDKKEIEKLMVINLRGEINKRIEPSEYLE